MSAAKKCPPMPERSPLDVAEDVYRAAADALDKLDAEISKARAEEEFRREAWAGLQQSSLTGDVADPVVHATLLSEAQDLHDSAMTLTKSLEKMRPALERKANDAEMRRDAQRQAAARPEAERRKAKVKTVWRAFLREQRDYLDYCRSNLLPFTGESIYFGTDADSLLTICREYGLSCPGPAFGLVGEDKTKGR